MQGKAVLSETLLPDWCQLPRQESNRLVLFPGAVSQGCACRDLHILVQMCCSGACACGCAMNAGQVSGAYLTVCCELPCQDLVDLVLGPDAVGQEIEEGSSQKQPDEGSTEHGLLSCLYTAALVPRARLQMQKAV